MTKCIHKVEKMADLEVLKSIHKAHDSYILSILGFNHYFKNEDTYS